MREQITLECTECHHRNYMTKKNKRTTTGRLERKKFCRFCKHHVLHRETK